MVCSNIAQCNSCHSCLCLLIPFITSHDKPSKPNNKANKKNYNYITRDVKKLQKFDLNVLFIIICWNMNFELKPFIFISNWYTADHLADRNILFIFSTSAASATLLNVTAATLACVCLSPSSQAMTSHQNQTTRLTKKTIII